MHSEIQSKKKLINNNYDKIQRNNNYYVIIIFFISNLVTKQPLAVQCRNCLELLSILPPLNIYHY